MPCLRGLRSAFSARFLILLGHGVFVGERGVTIAAEHAGRQFMLAQQAVKLGAVAVGNAGGVGDIAVGEFEQLHQIVALEALLGVSVGKRIHGR